MAHGDAREGKWRRNWRMQWVASTLHTTSEHGVSSITTADAHTSAASSRLNWRPRRFTWTRPFRRKTKSGFCACAITFQTQIICRAAELRGSSHYLTFESNLSVRDLMWPAKRCNSILSLTSALDGVETDHWTPRSAVVKKWLIPPRPTWLRGVFRDNFAFQSHLQPEWYSTSQKRMFLSGFFRLY